MQPRLLHLLVGAMTAAVLSGLTYAPSLLNQAAAFGYDIRDGRLVLVRIAGNELRIPARYFLPKGPQSGEQDSILLSALMPGMEPMREDNMDAFMKAKGFGRTISLLIQDARHTTGIDFRLDVAKKLGQPYERGEQKFGLE